MRLPVITKLFERRARAKLRAINRGYKKLVDELHLFQTPYDIGKMGKPMIINTKLQNLNLLQMEF